MGDSNLPASDTLLVKITTDEGSVGWGEAFGFRAVASVKLAVDQPGLLAAIHATAALGTADSMIEWRWFDLEATIYGDALNRKAAGSQSNTGRALDLIPFLM